MKKQRNFKENGQALVMVALAIVGLFAFAALAIDGSSVFSDRRHSQNASDTSAIAAALARVRTDTNPFWEDRAKERATDNGYTSDGVTQVDVYLCSDLPVVVDGFTLDCDGLPAGADPDQYVYVHIKSVVKLFFARIIGWSEVTNHTEAVARASVPTETPWADGYAMWSTHEGCKDPGDGEPFNVGGSAKVNITGAGVLVSASCPTQDSFVQNGTASAMLATSDICVVGTAENSLSNISPSPKEGCSSPDFSKYQLPNPVCKNEGSIRKENGIYVAYPGYFQQSFPSQVPGVGNGGVLKMQRGIYCFYDGMDVSAQWNISDMDGVLLVIQSSDGIKINGGATVSLRAISSTQYGFPKELVNYLIYVPPTIEANISLSGSSGSTFTGTILAPSSHIILEGNGGTLGLDCKIIADTIVTQGNGDINLTYNEASNATTTTNPDIKIIN